MGVRFSRILTVFCAGISVSAGSLGAQASPRRELPARPDGGLWWSVTTGAGSAKLTCDLCDPTRDLGPVLEGAVGTYANDQLRVGVEASGFTFLDDDFRETVYSAGLVAELHPWSARGLYVIGGLGWSGYRANDVDPGDGQDGFHYDAVRLRVGAGWDLPLTGSWVVGNRLTLDATSQGTLHDEGNPVAEAVGLSVLRLGIYVRNR